MDLEVNGDIKERGNEVFTIDGATRRSETERNPPWERERETKK